MWVVYAKSGVGLQRNVQLNCGNNKRGVWQSDGPISTHDKVYEGAWLSVAFIIIVCGRTHEMVEVYKEVFV